MLLKTASNLMTGFALLFTTLFYGQELIIEEGYTVEYSNAALELHFDVPVVVKATVVSDASELQLVSGTKPNSFVLTHLKPAEIIRLDFHYLNGITNEVHSSFLATPSLSSGTIDVYFNHPVDVTFAQTQNAVNLGNTLDTKLISYINTCQSTLDIAIYNSYSSSASSGIAGAINAAFLRGVQVRVIYDGSTSSLMIPLLNAGIQRLASPVGDPYGIMHNKFVVFDAANVDANKPIVWTGSTNWTTSQIDGPDRNSAIVIQDQALALGYTLEFEEMWGSNTATPNTVVSKFGPYKTNNTPHSYLIGGKTVNSYFSPSDGANAKIINAINSANSDIDIATMLITRSDISSALINKYSSGLSNLNIVLDVQNPSSNQLGVLQSGINASHVHTYNSSGIMHHKFMVVDNFNSASDPQVLVGSHNWSSSAEYKNDENTLIVHDANITNQYYQAFAYLYGQAGGLLSASSEHMNGDLVIFPNPTNGLITISSGSNIDVKAVDIRVSNVFGAIVFEQHLDSFRSEPLDLSGVSSGLYFVEIESSGIRKLFKVVKE